MYLLRTHPRRRKSSIHLLHVTLSLACQRQSSLVISTVWPGLSLSLIRNWVPGPSRRARNPSGVLSTNAQPSVVARAAVIEASTMARPRRVAYFIGSIGKPE